MNKTIGGIVSSVLMLLMFATVLYWKDTPMDYIFTFTLALIFGIGAVHLGVMVASWLESNDTTKGTS